MYKDKKRFVPVFRDFPEGCGVFSRRNVNAGESLMQSKCTSGVVQAHRDSSRTQEASSNPSETKSCIIEGLDNSRDVTKDEESVVESIGSVEDHQEKEVIGESENKQNQGLKCSVKKRRLSLHHSTMKVETDVVNTSKRAIVLGLAAESKCPWRQPKNRGSRQDKRRWIL